MLVFAGYYYENKKAFLHSKLAIASAAGRYSVGWVRVREFSTGDRLQSGKVFSDLGAGSEFPAGDCLYSRKIFSEPGA